MTEEIRKKLEDNLIDNLTSVDKESNERVKMILDALKADDQMKADALQQDKKAKTDERINNAKIIADEHVTQMKIEAEEKNLERRIAADKEIAAQKAIDDEKLVRIKAEFDANIAAKRSKMDLLQNGISGGLSTALRVGELVASLAIFAGALKFEQTNTITSPIVRSLGNKVAPKLMP